MPSVLLHIYGPLAIHSFGLMIVIGLIVILYLFERDKKLKQLISSEQLSTIIQISLVTGVAGGRIWFLMTNPSIIESWTDIFTVWSGGLSILGALIGIITALPAYLVWHKIPILPLLDRLALYAPLLQSISRFGCFFAGCCHGLPTNLPWGVMYTDVESLAPLHIIMHPTQIYSSILLFLTFVILKFFDRYKHQKAGQILMLYIMLTSTERFVVDFWRGDQEFFALPGYVDFLSIQQFLALSLFVGALIMLIFISMKSVFAHCMPNGSATPDANAKKANESI